MFVCPTCRYPNPALRDGRCVRCRSPLLLPLACAGRCTACAAAPACPSALTAPRAAPGR